MRRAIFIIHQYTGFAIGLYAIALCVTGALLILYENQIVLFRDDPMVRVAAAGAPLPLASLERSVERAYPEYPVHDIFESCPRGCSMDFTIWPHTNERWDVLVDPYTGRLLGRTVWQLGAIGFLYDFHAELFGGPTGARVNSVLGMMVVLLALTGLYLWPGWQSLTAGFGIRWKGDAWRVNFDLHKVLGISAFLFLAYIAFTGAAGEFLPEPTEGASVRAHPNGTPLQLDLLVSKASAALNGRITTVYPPETRDSPLKVRFIVPGDPDPYGMSFVQVDQYSGKVLAVQDLAHASLYRRLWVFLYPLHIGSVGGIGLRYLYCVLALLPIPLFITASSCG
jgi:uncharacterized iron-regulated membrane protein